MSRKEQGFLFYGEEANNFVRVAQLGNTTRTSYVSAADHNETLAVSTNWPHPDDPSYMQVVRDCGFTDPMTYCWEHEILHSLLPLRWYGRHGYVPWMAAHGRKMNLAAAAAEERMIYYFQRGLADAAMMMPYPEWQSLRQEMLDLRQQWRD